VPPCQLHFASGDLRRTVTVGRHDRTRRVSARREETGGDCYGDSRNGETAANQKLAFA
jgi:hypothetical protein